MSLIFIEIDLAWFFHGNVGRHALGTSPPCLPSDHLPSMEAQEAQGGGKWGQQSAEEETTADSTSPAVDTTTTECKLLVGSYSDSGVRKRNEDAHCVLLSLPGDESSSFFAVYDGHAGKNASAFCTYIRITQ